MACNLFVESPRVEIIDGKRVLVARGGRLCTGSPGENEVFVTLRLRHHRRFQTDRTLGEVTESGTAINIQVALRCQNSETFKVFAEVLLLGSRAKMKSSRVEVHC